MIIGSFFNSVTHKIAKSAVQNVYVQFSSNKLPRDAWGVSVVGL